MQEDFYSTALKTLISVSTVILLGLVVAYHGLEVQVTTKKILIYFQIGNICNIAKIDVSVVKETALK